jgi:hypothetical protein
MHTPAQLKRLLERLRLCFLALMRRSLPEIKQRKPTHSAWTSCVVMSFPAVKMTPTHSQEDECTLAAIKYIKLNYPNEKQKSASHSTHPQDRNSSRTDEQQDQPQD